MTQAERAVVGDLPGILGVKASRVLLWMTKIDIERSLSTATLTMFAIDDAASVVQILKVMNTSINSSINRYTVTRNSVPVQWG